MQCRCCPAEKPKACGLCLGYLLGLRCLPGSRRTWREAQGTLLLWNLIGFFFSSSVLLRQTCSTINLQPNTTAVLVTCFSVPRDAGRLRRGTWVGFHQKFHAVLVSSWKRCPDQSVGGGCMLQGLGDDTPLYPPSHVLQVTITRYSPAGV